MISVVMTMMMSSMHMMVQEEPVVWAQNTIAVDLTILLEEKVLEDLLEILVQVENPVLIVQVVAKTVTTTT